MLRSRWASIERRNGQQVEEEQSQVDFDGRDAEQHDGLDRRVDAPASASRWQVNITICRPSGNVIDDDQKHDRSRHASSRFETGPASVIMFSSRRIFVKLRVITGVGLAQPIRIPLKSVKPMSGPKMMSGGNDEGANRIDVVDGIQSHPALQPRRLIAQPRSHPCMGALVHSSARR